MVIFVNDFRLAAQKLGDNTIQRLQEDGHAIATSEWELFKVSFFDTFRSKQTISEKQALAQQVFLSAIRNEYGDDLANLASERLARAGAPTACGLEGRTVTTTTALIESHGGANWLTNETAIYFAAHVGIMPKDEGMGRKATLSILVDSECAACLEEARANGIPEESLSFISNYQKEAAKTGFPMTIPVLSDLIEKALRKAGKRVNPDGSTSLQRLEPDEIHRIAHLAVRQEIVGEINGTVYRQHADANPLLADLLAEARLREFTAPQMALFTLPGIASQIAKTERYAVAGTTEMLSKKKMQALRETIINQSLDHRQRDLALIDRLNLPEGPAKDDMIELCFKDPLPVNAQYFDQIMRTEEAITTLTETIMTLSPTRQKEQLLEFGSQLVSAANRAGATNGADDIARFIALSVDLFVARTPEEDFADVEAWMQSETAKALQAEILETAFEDDKATPELKAVASHLNYLFANLAKLANDRVKPMDPG